jgi:methylated-DNA-[protein]-cysteine S-methyltransferase
MPYLSFKSPVGDLTLFEEAGVLVSLEWGWVENGITSPLLEDAIQQLDDYFVGARTAFNLPLAPAGTDFQRRVWMEMGKIPFGHTKFYGDLAKTLRSSPRAVGTACGRNPLPILIPCHRVVPTAGGRGGYSGGDGAETKQYLLSLEDQP